MASHKTKDQTPASEQEIQPYSLPRFISRIVSYLPRHKLIFSVLVSMLTIQLIFTLMVPLAYKELFDNVLKTKNETALYIIVGLLSVGFIFNSIAGVLQDIAGTRLGFKVINDIRLTLFNKVHTFTEHHLANIPKGELLARFTTDSFAIRSAVSSSLPKFFFQIVVSFCAIGMLFFLDWKLALITFTLLPLVLIGPKFFMEKANAATFGRSKREAKIAALAQQSIAAHRVIRLFGLQKKEAERFDNQLDGPTKTVLKTFFHLSMFGRTAEVTMLFIQLTIISIGTYQVINNVLTAGSLIAFAGVLFALSKAVQELSRTLASLTVGSAALRRIDELLEQKPLESLENCTQKLKNFNHKLSFNNICFGYNKQENQLNNINLTINKSEKAAFIGQSGAGKSTLFQILVRSYLPTSGKIKIDELDFNEITVDSYFKNVGVIFQDSILIEGTIRENIKIGNQDATEEQIIEAAKLAKIHKNIANLTNGYDTQVGEGGSALSLGQRQQVCIARTVLKNPEIVIMDEPTSGLDPITEKRVHQAIFDFCKDKTLLMFTHRIGIVETMNKIVVLEKGRIAEQGDHHRLIKQEGSIYHYMHQQQSGFEFNEDGTQAEVTPERLKMIPLLSSLEISELEKIADRFVTQNYQENEIVFNEGDNGDRFYIIVRGAVEAITNNDNNEEIVLGIQETGNYFGEIALLKQSKRTASIRTKTPCTFLTLARQQFLNLVESSPEIKSAIEKVSELRQKKSKELGIKKAS